MSPWQQAVTKTSHLRAGRRKCMVQPMPLSARSSGRQSHRLTYTNKHNVEWEMNGLKLLYMIKQAPYCQKRKRIKSEWVGREKKVKKYEGGELETPVEPVSLEMNFTILLSVQVQSRNPFKNTVYNRQFQISPFRNQRCLLSSSCWQFSSRNLRGCELLLQRVVITKGPTSREWML